MSRLRITGIALMFFLTNVCMALDPTNAVPYTLTLTVENADNLGPKKYGFIAICNPESSDNPVVDSNNDANYVILTATLNPSWIGDSHIISWEGSNGGTSRLISAGANKRKVLKDQWMKESMIKVTSSFKGLEKTDTVSLVGCKIVYSTGAIDIVQSLETSPVHKTEVVFHSYPSGRDLSFYDQNGFNAKRILVADSQNKLPFTLVRSSSSVFDEYKVTVSLSKLAPDWDTWNDVNQGYIVVGEDATYLNNEGVAIPKYCWKFGREMVSGSDRAKKVAPGSSDVEVQLLKTNVPSGNVVNTKSGVLINGGSMSYNGTDWGDFAGGYYYTDSFSSTWKHKGLTTNEKGIAQSVVISCQFNGTRNTKCQGTVLGSIIIPPYSNTKHYIFSGTSFGIGINNVFSKWNDPKFLLSSGGDVGITFQSSGQSKSYITDTGTSYSENNAGQSIAYTEVDSNQNINDSVKHDYNKTYGVHQPTEEISEVVQLRCAGDYYYKLCHHDHRRNEIKLDVGMISVGITEPTIFTGKFKPNF